jgi:WD40 repeat protein
MSARALAGVLFLSLTPGFASWVPSEAAEPALRVDRYGDPLPLGALARFGTTRLRHGGYPQGLRFSPDGKALITWSAGDKAIRYWDVTNGKEIKRINGATYVAVGFSKQPRFACAEGKGAIQIRDETGKELRQLEPKTDKPRVELVFSYDGSTLASVHDFHVRESFSTHPLINLWDAATGRFLRQIDATDSMTRACVLLSSDGGTLAVGAANAEILLYDVKTGKLRYKLEAAGSVYHLAFTMDGTTLASYRGGGAVQLWDTRTGKLSGSLDPANRGGNSLTFSPDGKMLVVGTWAGMQVWNVNDRKLIHRFPFSTNWDDPIAISLDGKTLASIKYVVHLWDLTSGKELLPFDEPSFPGECLAFSPDGKHLAAGNLDGNRTEGDVYSYSFRIWNVTTGKQRHAIGKHTWTVHDLQYTPDGRKLISASADKSIRWWDAKTARELRYLEADDQVTSISLSPDGTLLATKGRRNEILLWNALTGDNLPSLRIGDHHVHRVAFGLGKRLLITTEYDWSNVRLWHIAQDRQSTLLPTDKYVSDPQIAVSPDGKILATASERGTVQLWELATGKERLRITLAGARSVDGIAFAAHGQVLAISGDETIYLCGIATGKELGRLKAPAGQGGLAFSPDGKQLGSLSRDTTILIWDVSKIDGERLASPRLEKDELAHLQTDIEGEDARKAHLAINALAGAPEQALALLKARLQPVVPLSEKEVAAFTAALDSEKFAVREAASRQLEAMEDLGESWLRKVLAAKPSLEVRRRVEQILARRDQHPVSARERIALRGVELLERTATRDAILYLQALGNGAPDARLTLDAQAALKRIRCRPDR